MILDPSPAPADITATAHALIATSTVPDGIDVVVAGLPIPVHAMRPPIDGRWDPAVPQVGWAFPVFDAAGEELVRMAWVNLDGVPDEDELTESPPGSDLRYAFATAFSVGQSTPTPCRLRMVRVPGVLQAFWIHGEARDAFVDLAGARMMSGPEFAATLLGHVEGAFADLIAEAEAESESS